MDERVGLRWTAAAAPSSILTLHSRCPSMSMVTLEIPSACSHDRVSQSVPSRSSQSVKLHTYPVPNFISSRGYRLRHPRSNHTDLAGLHPKCLAPTLPRLLTWRSPGCISASDTLALRFRQPPRAPPTSSHRSRLSISGGAPRVQSALCTSIISILSCCDASLMLATAPGLSP